MFDHCGVGSEFLRQRAGRTSPFANSGGLQSKFQASNARKTEARTATLILQS